jgi:starvation-inducible DNA-binding protein
LNVTGEKFYGITQTFENQYKQLESSIDEIAERISKLGGKRLGQWMNSQKKTRLKESPAVYQIVVK